ncbi:Uncharacterized protein K02A2.6 [Stylophora pistillata]|uniref:Uncharacterized protein K02A2.6 n=1 Tax=Stylophora pistillata TaxID=50429 RepID=A0A2B4SLX6_STYPI|nr:Uncharacterized protein K02A2.6 [Stylophora pistillata]
MLVRCDTAMELGVLKIINNIEKEDKKLRPVVTDIVSEYDCLFHGIGKQKHAKVKIPFDESVTPVAQVNRSIPCHYQDKSKEQLRKLKEAGVVESVPDDEPTTWISPLVIQPKKAAVRFSKLALNHGYHQFELDVGSRHLTTFSTPWGLKRYTRLNFGTVISQELFHEEVKKTIAGVQGAKNITDDIIVYGKTPELHDQALRDTLQKLKLNGLTLNRAKCLFDQSHIEVFGYVLSAERISPDPAKRWAEREQESFMKIKHSLFNNATLAYYEVGAEAEVIVDASPVGLGAMLTQKKKDGHRPVTYISRSLSSVEQRPWKDHPANYMSRHPLRIPENTTDYKEQKQKEEVGNSIIKRYVPESLSVEEVREVTVNRCHVGSYGNCAERCLPCQAATQQKSKEPLQMTELPERPWQKISLDCSGPYPSGEYCLIVVDDYLRYPVEELLSTTSAVAVIPRLDKIFLMFGIPEEFKSDNGPSFQSREFVEYARTSEENPEVRQKEALAKQKIKVYADKKANTKPSPIREVFQKKGSMVTAERRMTTRNTKDFKSCPAPTKETTQATPVEKADDEIGDTKPPPTVDVAEQTAEEPQSTSALPETVPSPHPPSAEEPRYPGRNRHKPARFKDYVCG